MYLHQFGLKQKPFQISIDPAFLWLGEKHKEALAVLLYGVHNNHGFLMLSGGVGTGKTTLIHSLLSRLDKQVTVATITDPGLAPMEFFNYIAHAYGMRRRYTKKVDFLFDFEKFLRRTRDAGRTALLIVDEAQRLEQALLEEIRLLSNIEDPDQKLLNTFFIGQEEFLNTLSAPENRALKQRITINYHLDTLNPEETEQLVRHRLKVAGATGEVFTPDAFPEIHAFSGGAPRLINILCDHALLTGFVKGINTIDADIIAECVEDLKLPGEGCRDLPQPPQAEPSAPSPEPAHPPRPKTATAAAGMMLQAAPTPPRPRRWPWAAAALLLLCIGLGVVWQMGWLETTLTGVTQETAPASRVLESGSVQTSPGKAAPLIGHEIPDPLPDDGTDTDLPLEDERVRPAVGSTDEPEKVPTPEMAVREEPPAAPTDTDAGPAGPDDVPVAESRDQPAGTPPSANAAQEELPKTLSIRDIIPDAPDNARVAARPASRPAESVNDLENAPAPTATPEATASLPDPGPGKQTLEENAGSPTPIPVTAFGRPTPVEPGLPATALPEAARTPEPERRLDRVTALQPIPVEDRLRAFLDAYCRAYESRDLARLRLFFAEDAVERGRPLESVLPDYARNFETLADLDYDIVLMDWKKNQAAATITLSGVFEVRYRLPGRDWRTTGGEISMDLAEVGGLLKIKRLDYEKK